MTPLPVRHETQVLPFTVALAAMDDLDRVAALRAQAYGHHLPGFAGGLLRPEPADLEPGNVVVVVTDKRDGRVMG